MPHSSVAAHLNPVSFLLAMEAVKPVGLGSPKSFLSCKPDSLQVQDVNVFKTYIYIYTYNIDKSICSWTSGCILFFSLCIIETTGVAIQKYLLPVRR